MRTIIYLFILVISGCSGDDNKVTVESLKSTSTALAVCTMSSDDTYKEDIKYANDVKHISCPNMVGDLKDLQKLPNLEVIWMASSHSNSLVFPELLNFKELFISQSNTGYIDISNLNLLETLRIDRSPNLEQIDLSKNSNLENIRIQRTSLQNIDLSEQTSLSELWIGQSNIEYLSLDENKNLTKLLLIGNKLSEIVINHPLLEILDITSNGINYVAMNAPELKILYAAANNISQIDLSATPNLTQINLMSNEIENINLDFNNELILFNGENNPFTNEAIDYLNSIDWIEDIRF